MWSDLNSIVVDWQGNAMTSRNQVFEGSKSPFEQIRERLLTRHLFAQGTSVSIFNLSSHPLELLFPSLPLGASEDLLKSVMEPNTNCQFHFLATSFTEPSSHRCIARFPDTPSALCAYRARKSWTINGQPVIVSIGRIRIPVPSKHQFLRLLFANTYNESFFVYTQLRSEEFRTEFLKLVSSSQLDKLAEQARQVSASIVAHQEKIDRLFQKLEDPLSDEDVKQTEEKISLLVPQVVKYTQTLAEYNTILEEGRQSTAEWTAQKLRVMEELISNTPSFVQNERDLARRRQFQQSLHIRMEETQKRFASLRQFREQRRPRLDSPFSHRSNEWDFLAPTEIADLLLSKQRQSYAEPDRTRWDDMFPTNPCTSEQAQSLFSHPLSMLRSPPLSESSFDFTLSSPSRLLSSPSPPLIFPPTHPPQQQQQQHQQRVESPHPSILSSSDARSQSSSGSTTTASNRPTLLAMTVFAVFVPSANSSTVATFLSSFGEVLDVSELDEGRYSSDCRLIAHLLTCSSFVDLKTSLVSQPFFRSDSAATVTHLRVNPSTLHLSSLPSSTTPGKITAVIATHSKCVIDFLPPDPSFSTRHCLLKYPNSDFALTAFRAHQKWMIDEKPICTRFARRTMNNAEQQTFYRFIFLDEIDEFLFVLSQIDADSFRQTFQRCLSQCSNSKLHQLAKTEQTKLRKCQEEVENILKQLKTPLNDTAVRRKQDDVLKLVEEIVTHQMVWEGYVHLCKVAHTLTDERKKQKQTEEEQLIHSRPVFVLSQAEQQRRESQQTLLADKLEESRRSFANAKQARDTRQTKKPHLAPSTSTEPLLPLVDTRPSKTLWLQNLPKGCTQQTVSRAFASLNVTHLTAPTTQPDDADTMFIQFGSNEEADTALKMSNTLLIDGRVIQISECAPNIISTQVPKKRDPPPKRRQPQKDATPPKVVSTPSGVSGTPVSKSDTSQHGITSSILLRNLPSETISSQITGKFRPKTIFKVVLMDAPTDSDVTTAVVEFVSREAAETALKKRGNLVIKGRPIEIVPLFSSFHIVTQPSPKPSELPVNLVELSPTTKGQFPPHSTNTLTFAKHESSALNTPPFADVTAQPRKTDRMAPALHTRQPFSPLPPHSVEPFATPQSLSPPTLATLSSPLPPLLPRPSYVPLPSPSQHSSPLDSEPRVLSESTTLPHSVPEMMLSPHSFR
ncbi:hypothetical protein BLNAU_7722 [Blattamonas nauphoetae]|uniref:RRM domain-containing protein n=1 Tax=Blattamonas nauphoetae TaxID=2049346 RepID=A0ABQ9Y0U2_9EUKA|nr:hypothetical protein BLNAU_7722 [Blattamonas nauphoetae]